MTDVAIHETKVAAMPHAVPRRRFMAPQAGKKYTAYTTRNSLPVVIKVGWAPCEDAMKRAAFVGLACSMLVAVDAPVRAHHSAAAFDTQKTVTVTGTILQYSFANPHIYITL